MDTAVGETARDGLASYFRDGDLVDHRGLAQQMRTHMTNVGVITEACERLKDAGMKREQQHQLLPLVLESMSTHQTCVDVQSSGVELVCELESPSSAVADAAEAVVRAMLAHPSHSDMQCTGMSALMFFFEAGPVVMTRLRGTGVAKAVVHLIPQAFNDVDLCWGGGEMSGALAVLDKLAGDDIIRTQLGEAGVARALVSTMLGGGDDPWGGDDSSCLNSIEATERLSKYEDLKAKLREAGAAHAVAIVMNSCTKSWWRWNCLAAINSLTADADTAIWRETVVAQAVVAAMRDGTAESLSAGHINDLQLEAICTVCNLACDDSNNSKLGQAGVAAALVAVMGDYPADSKIQLAGLKAIFNLARDDTNKTELGQAGAAGAVVNAMGHHLTHCDIQFAGTEAISSLASNQITRAKLRQAGTAVTVVAAMANHLADANTQLAGIKIICKLASYKIIRAELGKAGVAAAVVAAMRLNQQDAGLQLAGINAIFSIARNDVNNTLMGEAGAADVVVAAMGSHPANSNIQRLGVRAMVILRNYGQAAVEAALRSGVSDRVTSGALALGNLCFDRGFYEVEDAGLGVGGTAAALTHALSNHAADTGVCRAGVLAVFKFQTRFKSGAHLLQQNGTVEAVKKVCVTHAADPKITEWGGLVIEHALQRKRKAWCL